MKHSQNFLKFPKSTNCIPPTTTPFLLMAFFNLPLTHTGNYSSESQLSKSGGLGLYYSYLKSKSHLLTNPLIHFHFFTPITLILRISCYDSSPTAKFRRCNLMALVCLSKGKGKGWDGRHSMLLYLHILWNPIALTESRRKIILISIIESLSSPLPWY